MKNCEFCNLSAEDKKWLLYEDEYWYLFLADKQDYAGRCIIVCKQHCESISALGTEQWLSLKNIMTNAETMLKFELGADAFNWSCLMNDAYKKDDPAPHIHFHLRPRYAKPVHIGDAVFTDKKFGHHYNNKAASLDKNTSQIIFELLKAGVDKYFK